MIITPNFKRYEIFCNGKDCSSHDNYNFELIKNRMLPVLWAMEAIRAKINGEFETDSIQMVVHRGWSCDERHKQIYEEQELPVNWNSYHRFRSGGDTPCAVDFEILDRNEMIDQVDLHEHLWLDLRDTWPAGFHQYDWGFHIDTAEGGKRRW